MYQAYREPIFGFRVWLPFYAETKKEVKEKLVEYGEDLKDIMYEKVSFPMLSPV
jgi:hypothetical protein